MSYPCPPFGGIITLNPALEVVPIPVLVRLARTPQTQAGRPGKNCIDPWVYPCPPSVTNTSETFPKESTVIAFLLIHLPESEHCKRCRDWLIVRTLIINNHNFDLSIYSVRLVATVSPCLPQFSGTGMYSIESNLTISDGLIV